MATKHSIEEPRADNARDSDENGCVRRFIGSLEAGFVAPPARYVYHALQTLQLEMADWTLIF